MYYDLSGLHRGDNDPLSHRPAWPATRHPQPRLRTVMRPVAPTIRPVKSEQPVKKP